jgi:hypothetical protein
MQPVPSFIDHAKARHDAPDFKSIVIRLNGELVYDLRELSEFQVRRHFVGNE